MGKINTVTNGKIKGLKSSLKGKLILSYVIVALVPIILISALTYFNSRRVLKNKIGDLSSTANMQIKLNVDNYLNEIENSASLVFAHDNINVFDFADKSIDRYEREQTKSEIEEYLLSISLMHNFTDFVLIYSDGSSIGKMSETTKKIYDANELYIELQEKVKDIKNRASWFTGKDSNYKKLYYTKQVNNNVMMLTSIYTDELDEIFGISNDTSGSDINLLDNENRIIYSNNKSIIGTIMDEDIVSKYLESGHGTFESADYLVSYNVCENGWKLVNTVPKSYIFKELTLLAMFTAAIAVIFIILSGMAGLICANKISGPILKIVTKMKQAESGDLTVKIDVEGDTELATLSRSFNVMIEAIRNLIDSSKRVSSIVNDESLGIKQMSIQTYEAAEEVSAAMSNIAGGAMKQSEELDTTMNVIEELSKKIENIDDNISNATTISGETREIGDKSLEIVKQLKDKTHNTNYVMNEIVYNIDVLGSSIVKIEEVIEFIKSISDQINILSLNASIEAARAGEYGNGFAVVAEEVKKLANQSKESIEEIYSVIRNICNRAEEAKKLVDNSKSIFKEQMQVVEYTNESFQDIVNHTEKIIYEIENINNLMNDINKQKDKALYSTNNIKEITENSSANTEEVLAATQQQTASAETLGEHSNKLNDTVKLLEDSLKKFIV